MEFGFDLEAMKSLRIAEPRYDRQFCTYVYKKRPEVLLYETKQSFLSLEAPLLTSTRLGTMAWRYVGCTSKVSGWSGSQQVRKVCVNFQEREHKN